MTANPKELYDRAKKLGLHLEARGDKLAVSPASLMPPALADELKENKSALLEWLKSPPSGWRSVPPVGLPLAQVPPKLTSRDARLVMAFIVRQINGADHLCEWALKRETHYWDKFGWSHDVCALAAAVDVATHQLRRGLADALDLLRTFEEIANPRPAAKLLPAPAARKPFLKWAGAKTQVVPNLVSLMPDGDFRLIEPFAGSGAVYLNTPYRRAVVADSNADLIGVYRMLRERGEDFIRECHALFIPANNTEDQYYRLRDEFNCSGDIARRAALFVYLTRHCFNGLYRVNRDGRFNVPFGLYDRPFFPGDEMRAFAARLTATEVDLRIADFRETLAAVGEGDCAYLDPPYLPAVTNGFTDYSANGFTLADHRDLADLARQAAERGAHVIVSNHDVPAARELYDGAEKIVEVEVRRSISCKSETRGAVGEIMAIFRPRND